MNNIIIKKTGIMIMMLVFFMLPTHSISKVYTCHTLPEESIFLSLETVFVEKVGWDRKDSYQIGFGLTDALSGYIETSTISREPGKFPYDVMGDSSLELTYSPRILEFGKVHAGFILRFNLPTGPDVYEASEWVGLSYGRNDMTTGLAISRFFGKRILTNINLLYTFREGEDENLYSGMNFDFSSGSAYIELFGLNPFYSGTFFDGDKLKNDFITVSGSLMGELWGLVCILELYYSFNPHGENDSGGPVAVEGNGVDPLWVNVGLKYFFNPRVLRLRIFPFLIRIETNITLI